MYGISLSFVSLSTYFAFVYDFSCCNCFLGGNPNDVIIDGAGSNEVSPFMILYEPFLTTKPAHLPVNLSISGMTFKNCGTFVADIDAAEYIYGGAIFIDSANTSSVSVNIHFSSI
jgi:hypothetical protein